MTTQEQDQPAAEVEEEVVETEEEVTSESDEQPEASQEEDQDGNSKLLKALKAERESVKELKKELRAIKEVNESDPERIAREAREEVESKYKKVLATSQAKAQLTSMGLTSNPDRFLKILDLDDVEVAADGSVTGLDAQLQAIKEEFPELFEKKAPAPKVDAGNKKAVDEDRKMSSAQRLAARLHSGE